MAVHMSTVISRELGHITEHLSKLQPILSQHPLLYTISASQNTRSSDLSILVSSLQGLSHRSVGCLSAAIPSAGPSWRQHTSVSLAAFDERHATLFRSTIPGRKAVQVGRWHAMHKDAQPDHEEPALGESMPDWDNTMSRVYEGQALPVELESLRAADVHSILYFSDNAPEGLCSSLLKFRLATKLGLIGTSTPFVTGRPYTLFHNERIHSDGAVGVCLSSSARPAAYSVFPGLEAITRPMIVTDSDGNLVNSLDHANPSSLLLHAIKNHPAVAGSAQGISPDLRLYIGTLHQKANGHQELVQLSSIMSGDPSRGSIALDAEGAPAEGSLVQIFLLPPSASLDVLGEAQRHSGAPEPRLAFASTSLDEAEARSISEEVEDHGATVLEDTFLAASENGCIVSRSADGESERPWKCAVPGATMGLQWAA
ncbi:hypothetical protein TRAPUB_10063 [Trametes pubescens]|uniref:FIST domain-containing protein n=1 Tax=Trametes pubescens TaxID=154538 RepID=A0A1M2W0A5_TRAPU|nr:hypothetical protein TRAPUB_10063 [Trametes pubescens]